MKIKELETLLENIQTKGYTLLTHGESISEIEDITEYNLREHIKQMIKKYNIHNSDKYNSDDFKINKKVYLTEKQVNDPELWKIYKDKEEKPYKNKLRDFDELEQEIKNKYSEITPENKITELIQKIPINHQDRYMLRHDKKMYDLLEKTHKNSIVQLFKNKILFKLSIEKSNFLSKEWRIGNNWESRNFKELFKYLWNIEINTDTWEKIFPYNPTDTYFINQPIDLEDITLKVYKNGKLILEFKKDNEKRIELFNKLVKKKYQNNEYVLVVE